LFFVFIRLHKVLQGVPRTTNAGLAAAKATGKRLSNYRRIAEPISAPPRTR
jgi:hypothetical protein